MRVTADGLTVYLASAREISPFNVPIGHYVDLGAGHFLRRDDLDEWTSLDGGYGLSVSHSEASEWMLDQVN